MKKLKIGNEIKLWGGYDYDPEFLKDPPHKARTGTVIKFIPTPSGNGAAVVKLDFPITCKEVTGDYLILTLRQEGQTWSTEGPVHLELCDFLPEDKLFSDRKQGLWVESHAEIQILKGA
jgi:hypothetical protein